MSRHDASVQTAARHARRAGITGRPRFQFDFIWNYHPKKTMTSNVEIKATASITIAFLSKKGRMTATWNTKWNKQHEANTKTPVRNALNINFN